MRQLDESEKKYLETIQEIAGEPLNPIKIEDVLTKVKALSTIKITYTIGLEGPDINYYHLYQEEPSEDFHIFEKTLASFYNLIERLNKENWVFKIERHWPPLGDNVIINNLQEGKETRIQTHSEELKNCLINLIENYIYPTKGLFEFINNEFKTNEEIRLNTSLKIAKKNYRIAIVACIIAFLAAVSSIVIDLKNRDKNEYSEIISELKTIIQNIDEELKDINSKIIAQDSVYSLPSYLIIDANSVNVRNSPELGKNTITGNHLNKGDLIIVKEKKNFEGESWLRVYYPNKSTGQIESGWVLNDSDFFY